MEKSYKMQQIPILSHTALIHLLCSGKFFIMSTEFDKNISDLSHDCTDHKNGNDFFMSLVKWQKIAVKKSQIFLEILGTKVIQL